MLVSRKPAAGKGEPMDTEDGMLCLRTNSHALANTCRQGHLRELPVAPPLDKPLSSRVALPETRLFAARTKV